MSIHIALNHITHYQYDRPVYLGPQVIRLRPAPHCRTPILSYTLKVEPQEHFINWQQDPFANYQARLVFRKPTSFLKITVDLIAEMAVYNPFDFFVEPEADNFPFTYTADLARDLALYLQPAELTPLLREYLATCQLLWLGQPRTINFLIDLNHQVQRDIAYLSRLEPGIQSPEETLLKRTGSCRDSAWLLIQLLRHMGLAARFVSGYLIQLQPDIEPLEGPKGATHDFTDLHAWCEVYLPGAGWIGLDPTSGLLTGVGHIPVACSPYPSGAAPIIGVVEQNETTFQHAMNVTRIHESPRVTKPYREEQWQQIDALGHLVEQKLATQNISLATQTQYTFVAEQEREGAEWHTEIAGPTKGHYALKLIDKLQTTYPPSCFRLASLAQQAALVLGQQPDHWTVTRLGQWTNQQPVHTLQDAQHFIEQLADVLNLKRHSITPCYINPPVESAAVGSSCLYFQSVLQSLAPTEVQTAYNACSQHATLSGYSLALAPFSTPPNGLPVACLTIQLLENTLYVLLPGQQQLDNQLALRRQIEALAHSLKLTLVVIAADAPADQPLACWTIQLATGVLQVNPPKTGAWSELVTQTQQLYQAAHETHLSPEKFLLDGRQTGTGSDNYVCLSAATATGHPIKWQTDLLLSLQNYWHQHPALNRLFSIAPMASDNFFISSAALQQQATSAEWHKVLDQLEISALDMLPHPAMSLAAQLLLRSLMAWFGQKPYVTQIAKVHSEDTFVLPTPIREDFQEVIRDLQSAGFPFDPTWFEPHFEFRFPLIGQTAIRGVTLTLRNALELGSPSSQNSAPGLALPVMASSIECLEIKINNIDIARYIVTVNGCALPLKPTSEPAAYIAGVRYRAWNGPSLLQPDAPLCAPLTFDLVDTWNHRSLGGCQYHITHPSGYNYSLMPINSYEAESRRYERFSKTGHTPGTMHIKKIPASQGCLISLA